MDRGEPFILRNNSSPVAKAVLELMEASLARLKEFAPTQSEAV
jgi:hypothetical protein